MHEHLAARADAAAERETELALARADEPGDPHDLPCVEIEGRSHHRSVVGREVADLEHPRTRRDLALVEEVGDLATDHHAHETLFRCLRERSGADEAAVAKHGGRRRALVDLAQPVRDEDDPDAAVSELRQPLEEALRRRLRQRARSLVEDEQPRLGRDGARHLYLLLQLDAQLADLRARIDVDAEVVERGAARRDAVRQSMTPARRGRRPMSTFSATVSVGASVSSWLIATMPCSIA